MLKPRAETGGERKSKPTKERIVNPRFQARNARALEIVGGPAQGKLSQARAKGVDRGSKAYKKLETSAFREKERKVAKFFEAKAPKNGKTYSKSEQKRNVKSASEAISKLGRRDKALVKQILTDNATASQRIFGGANKDLIRQATRTGKGAKGGGKVRKTNVRGITAAQRVTVKSGRTTRSVKSGLLQQRYTPRGKVPKGVNARTQSKTRFKGETAPLKRGGRTSGKKTGGFKKKQ